MFKTICKANLLILFSTCLYSGLESSYAEPLELPLDLSVDCSNFLIKSPQEKVSVLLRLLKHSKNREFLYNSAGEAIKNTKMTQEELAQIMKTLEISEPLRTNLINKVKSMSVQSAQNMNLTLSHIDGIKITRPNLQGYLLRSLMVVWDNVGPTERNMDILISVKDQLASFLIDLLNIPTNKTSLKPFKEIEDTAEVMIKHIYPPTRKSVNVPKLFASLVKEMQFDVREEGGNRYTRLRDHPENIAKGYAKAKKLLEQLGFLSIEDFGNFIAKIRWERRLFIYHALLSATEMSSSTNGFLIRYPYTFNIYIQKYANIIRQDIENPYLVQNDLIAMLELLQSKEGRPDKDFYALISTYQEPLVNAVGYEESEINQEDLVSIANRMFDGDDDSFILGSSRLGTHHLSQP